MTRAVQHLVNAGYAPGELETYIIMGLPQQSLNEVIDTILYANSLRRADPLVFVLSDPGTVDYQARDRPRSISR
jgi:hypothetical protein